MPHRILVTKPILTQILIHVDERTLLVSCQRVCRFWRTHIQSSSPLLKKLFLEPDLSTATKKNPRINPLLIDAFPFCFRDEHSDAKMYEKKSIRRESASWRDMELRQPPLWGIGSVWTKDDILRDSGGGILFPPVGMSELFMEILKGGEDHGSGFRVIWEPVPGDDVVNDELEEFGVVVVHHVVGGSEMRSTSAGEYKLLCDVLCNPTEE
ncbi:hypothetical protein GGS20DRAFT_451922 [Poronia punctata]|nr:hypothetical protein GGS20DRAFT_451922 [Poronia punctata]